MNKPKHPKNKNNKRILLIALILVAIAAVVYMLDPLMLFHGKLPQKKVVQPTLGALEKQDFEDENFENNGKWYGLCKKNSIHSVEDFRQTVFNDPTLKAHFADFNWENASMGKLDRETWVYIHYRKNDTIVRKKAPIKLRAGDGYITDGTTTVRTYCCNSYSQVSPVYKPEDLDAEPAAGPTPPVIQDPVIPPVSPPAPTVVVMPPPPPPVYPSIYDKVYPPVPPPKTPPTVPETATGVLLGVGLASLGILCFKHKKKSH